MVVDQAVVVHGQSLGPAAGISRGAKHRDFGRFDQGVEIVEAEQRPERSAAMVDHDGRRPTTRVVTGPDLEGLVVDHGHADSVSGDGIVGVVGVLLEGVARGQDRDCLQVIAMGGDRPVQELFDLREASQRCLAGRRPEHEHRHLPGQLAVGNRLGVDPAFGDEGRGLGAHPILIGRRHRGHEPFGPHGRGWFPAATSARFAVFLRGIRRLYMQETKP